MSPPTKISIAGLSILIGIVISSSYIQCCEEADKLAALQIPKTGGLGAVRGKDDDVTKAVEKIKPALEEKTGTKYESIEVLSYKSQIVAGRNYFVKAKVKPVTGPDSIVHLRIYRDLRDNYELTQYQINKTEDEELKYFQ